ncbi:unnamed protein product, partial [marine sediment metagenome]
LVSGIKIDGRTITPSGSSFLKDYFKDYRPETYTDYKDVVKGLFAKDLSAIVKDLATDPKSSTMLRKWNFIGRGEIINLIAPKISTDSSIDEHYKSILVNYVTRNTDNPVAWEYDINQQLRQILTTGVGRDVIIIGGEKRGLKWEKKCYVGYDELIDVLSPEMIFTLLFEYRNPDKELLLRTDASPKVRAKSAYFLDIDVT